MGWTQQHEQSALSGKSQSEGSQLLHEFESKSRDLETDFENRQEEMEKHVHDVRYLRGAVQREKDEIRSERCPMENENQEVTLKKKQLEAHQLKMHREIDELNVLSKTLKDQREQFVKERDGEPSNFPRLIVPTVDRINLKSDSGGHKSWIRKCTSTISKLSPTKMIRHDQNLESPLSAVEVNRAEKTAVPTMPVDVEEARGKSIAEEGQEPSGWIANDSFDFQQLPFGSVIGEVDIVHLSIDRLGSNQRKPGRKPKVGICRSLSVKAAVEDTKVILCKMLHVPRPNEDSRGDSDHVEKASCASARKQHRAQTKRRQTVAPRTLPLRSRQPSYLNIQLLHKMHFVTAAKASADIKKKKEKQDDDGRDKSVSFPEFPSEKVVRFKPATDDDVSADAAKLGENVGLSGEVNGISEYAKGDDFDDNSDAFDGVGDIDHVDDEPKHPGQGSTTKKLWKFFTA
ncbi:hypothetical protein Acr_29g0004820 [Actinidia rufa]|uniref:Uncharacterized protein n=1 Tax=Actinidia rufa TaxID=165716 RepID=A0A7J0HDW1_9ERIC|nr:hypothetical protein Acr_29g0004820 [Actinidia rufa]